MKGFCEASIAVGDTRDDSKVNLCLFNSDEVGVCGGVSNGLATSHTPEKPNRHFHLLVLA